MPSKNSYPVLITDFEGLLEATNRTPEVQASAETERQALAQTLAEIQSLRARQAELTALKQGVTQQLKAAMAKAKEQRTQVQSLAKGKLGPRNEHLVHFKVVPQGRPRKPRKEAKKPNGETPGTKPGDPGTSVPPSDKPTT